MRHTINKIKRNNFEIEYSGAKIESNHVKLSNFT